MNKSDNPSVTGCLKHLIKRQTQAKLQFWSRQFEHQLRLEQSPCITHIQWKYQDSALHQCHRKKPPLIILSAVLSIWRRTVSVGFLFCTLNMKWNWGQSSDFMKGFHFYLGWTVKDLCLVLYTCSSPVSGQCSSTNKTTRPPKL